MGGDDSLLLNTAVTSYTDIGLSEGATYYYRVSAYNSAGESYTSSYAFVIPGPTFTDNRDGKTYRKVFIGGKTWMAENLNFSGVTDGSWCYDDKVEMCDKYGKLYNWNTAMTVCPIGWHLPSRQEWGDLAITAGGTGDYGVEGTAGKTLKSPAGWLSSEDHKGTDDFGFSAKPGGLYESLGNGSYNPDNRGSFLGESSMGCWWTNTEDSNGNVYARRINGNADHIAEDVKSAYDKQLLSYSVRCIQN